MRVLHFIDCLTVGGAEKLVVNYLLNLEKNEIDNNKLMVLYKVNSFLEEEIEKKGIEIIYLNCKNKYDFFKVIKIIKYINNNNIDIVHVHLFPALYFGYIVKCIKKRIKFIYTEHNTTNKRRNKILFKIIEKNIYKKYDLIVACSNNVRKALAMWIDISEEEIITLNNGVIDKFKYNKKKKIEYDFILIGSLRSEAKGVDMFLEALSYIHNEFEKAIILGDGILKDEYMKLAQNLDLQNKVVFAGNVNNVDEYLKKSKIFICSSRWEGLPLVILEAMSSRTPIISTKVGEIANILNDKEEAILIEPNNIKELAIEMKNLISNLKLRQKLSYNARIKFEEEFDMKNYSYKLQEIYRSFKG